MPIGSSEAGYFEHIAPQNTERTQFFSTKDSEVQKLRRQHAKQIKENNINFLKITLNGSWGEIVAAVRASDQRSREQQGGAGDLDAEIIHPIVMEKRIDPRRAAETLHQFERLASLLNENIHTALQGSPSQQEQQDCVFMEEVLDNVNQYVRAFSGEVTLTTLFYLIRNKNRTEEEITQLFVREQGKGAGTFTDTQYRYDKILRMIDACRKEKNIPTWMGMKIDDIEAQVKAWYAERYLAQDPQFATAEDQYDARLAITGSETLRETFFVEDFAGLAQILRYTTVETKDNVEVDRKALADALTALENGGLDALVKEKLPNLATFPSSEQLSQVTELYTATVTDLLKDVPFFCHRAVALSPLLAEKFVGLGNAGVAESYAQIYEQEFQQKLDWMKKLSSSDPLFEQEACGDVLTIETVTELLDSLKGKPPVDERDWRVQLLYTIPQGFFWSMVDRYLDYRFKLTDEQSAQQAPVPPKSETYEVPLSAATDDGISLWDRVKTVFSSRFGRKKS